ncbi:MAG: hypothetical protein D6786_00200 [Gammaproteobacteria bacterium]|nr:MAG: hypothetical protein D6786_00200 [Gammaproteobacteria bacterium]
MADPVRFHRVMGFTRSEFLRLLPLLELSPRDGRSHAGPLGRGEVTLRMGEQGERRLGSFVLPELPVELEFRDCEEGEVEAFLRRFDRVYQRGGG